MKDNNSDYILDQALQSLSKGETFDDANLTPEQKLELSSTLQIAQLLSNIPKANIPTPTKQYRYAQKVSVFTKFVEFISSHRIAVTAAMFAFIITGTYSGYHAAENSLPGDKLYGIKLIGEEARINLTFDQDKVANLHLALAEKRLDETKRVIEINNPEQEAAAIVALTTQTEKTFSAVSEIATAKAVSQNDSRLLDNLVAINKEQKSVLENASRSESTKESAEVALSATKQTGKSLAKIIATVNEQALLDLPNKISITGTINSYGKNKLVIEKSTFVVNDATVVIGSTGELVVDRFDKIEGKVTVIGTKDNDSILAKKIIIIDGSTSLASDKTPTKGEVKGVTTTKPEVKPTTTNTPNTTTTPSEPVDNISPQKPSQTQAGFIIEPSEQQYVP